ncbi:MAG: asparagine synthase (glutamine-hydrolyzing) [Epsilonproteobacteria bacterium]|nr:asparagine synthase (glutamine-hydrolyzing) [Campylobacterota bacterium]
MCGISGIIYKKGGCINKNEIKEMNRLITHRGPDDEGYFFGGNFTFGHRRLSILDLTKAGRQPMEYLGKNGRYVITYNGEIYNYLELKEILMNEGYVFKSNSDTEVVLACYDKWGERCVEYFNGMWAFAIYDEKKNAVFMSRDRYGIKPLYYANLNDKFVFGSEIKQLLGFSKKNFVNESVLGEYLVFGLEEHTDETFFKNVFKLTPGHNLIYNLNKHEFKIKKFYDITIDEKLKLIDEERALEGLKTLLKNSVDFRFRSDVKVGICLSGGLDSAIIASTVKLLNKNNTVAVHAKSIEKKTDESAFAKEVAKHCELDLKIVEPNLEEIFDSLRDVFYAQEEPFGSPSIVMQYFVMKRANEENCKVMLDGQGADEIFFGYERYYSFYLASLLKEFKFKEFFIEMINIKPFKLSKKQILKSVIGVLFRGVIFKTKYRLNTNIKLKYHLDIDRVLGLFKTNTFNEFQIKEIKNVSLPHLLKYEDKNSMRHSVEARVPYLDYRLVHFGLSLNEKLKYKNGYLKYILRKVVENRLPSFIVWRKNKFGFEAPTDKLMEKYKSLMIKKIRNSELLRLTVDFEEEKIQKNHKLLWRLYSVAMWEEIYEVKVDK